MVQSMYVWPVQFIFANRNWDARSSLDEGQKLCIVQTPQFLGSSSNAFA